MRKKLFILLAGVLTWVGPQAVAAAQNGDFYLTPKIGLGYISAKNVSQIDGLTYSGRESKSKFSGALAVGYDFYGAPVRAELEYTLRGTSQMGHSFSDGQNNWLNNQKLTVNTLMTNFYYDIETSGPVTPYIGAGLGLAFVKGESELSVGGVVLGNGRHSATKFAWDAGAGLAWDITDTLALDLGYRYFNVSNIDTGDYASSQFGWWNNFSAKADNVNLHEVMLGLRISY